MLIEYSGDYNIINISFFNRRNYNNNIRNVFKETRDYRQREQRKI